MNTSTAYGLGGDFQSTAERRRHPRVAGPFRATVRGVGTDGREFAEEAELKNVSGGGLYIRLTERVERGTVLDVEITLSGAVGAGNFTASCHVLRTERLIDGRHGVAAAFRDTQFLA